MTGLNSIPLADDLDLVDVDPKPPLVCDVFAVLSAAAREAGRPAVSRGRPLSLDLSPALRAPRAVDRRLLIEALEAMVHALACAGGPGPIQVDARGDKTGRYLTLTVGTMIGQGTLADDAAFAPLSRHARALGGHFSIGWKRLLTLKLVFPAPRARQRVLVLDADAAVRAPIARLLAASGYAVDEAATGEAAERLLGRSEHVAAFLDLNAEAPGVFALAKLARGRSPGVRLFGLKPRTAAVSQWALTQAGFSGVLETPPNSQGAAGILAQLQSRRPNS